ncbi:pyridoxamine 5'-phosphate oxidase family protein [Streptomyces jumonjinensis]|uniref:Pyridoxamine 5'-phosphate oxidase family protein n=1 Tax=Streptomyces jumonjinensis TaxID=1945 RepID=A0A646KA37_STRJU|nr:pyridoxamine 5'-phosphate oxidase family protein [Streptomyces jumonjinensis]MQS98959.1 pyridoxamine 5'-phosphate oxidase family protein [Streptomyces jumonjinensis]
MTLTREERQQFLAEPHIAALAVETGDEGRAPLAVPVWYQYAPGRDVWIMTGLGSRKERLIARAGRFSLLVDRVEPSVRYVSVEGPVVSAAPATRQQLVEITARYLPARKVASYVEFAEKELGEQVVIHMRPQRWNSAELGPI